MARTADGATPNRQANHISHEEELDMTTPRKIASIMLLALIMSGCTAIGGGSSYPGADVTININQTLASGSTWCPKMTVTFAAAPIHLTGNDGKSGTQTHQQTWDSVLTSGGGEFETCHYGYTFLQLKEGEWNISVAHNFGSDGCTMTLLRKTLNVATFTTFSGQASCT